MNGDKLMKKLKRIYIEITNVCNLACDFCPQTKRQPEFMKLETFNKILEQIKPHTDYIYLHVKGEPLLHPQIDQFLNLSYEKGFKVNITTNGTLINKEKHKLLNKPALRLVNFSLHSFDGNEGGTNKEEYISNIISFVKEDIDNTNILASLRLWNLEEDNIKNLKKQKNRCMLEMIEHKFNLSYKIEEKIEKGRGIKISDRVYLNQDFEFEWPDLEKAEDKNRGFCHGARSHMAILVDGTVVPCCLDGEGVIKLGNIHETHFNEIIQGQRANCMVNGFSNGEVVEELCRKCGYRKRFNAK